jgi:L-fuculose-phosphate aldolase
MSNHGSVAVGATIEQAVEHLALLEWLCRLHRNATCLGTPRVLDEGQQTAVVEAVLRRGYGSTRPKEQP